MQRHAQQYVEDELVPAVRRAEKAAAPLVAEHPRVAAIVRAGKNAPRAIQGVLAVAAVTGLVVAYRTSRRAAQRVWLALRYDTPTLDLAVKRHPLLAQTHPAFGEVLAKVLVALENRGFSPQIDNTWRSRLRQIERRIFGKSKVWYSFHNVTGPGGLKLAMAADVMDRKCGYDEGSPCARRFWDALEQEANKVGLTTGKHWTSPYDPAHIQLVPDSENSRWLDRLRGGWLPSKSDVEALGIRLD